MPAAASADWMITPSIGLKFAGHTNIVNLEQGAGNTKMTLGVSVTVLSDEILGVEGELGYSPRFFERSGATDLIARSNVTTVTGNVIAAVPRRITRDSLRPFAVAGVGLLHIGIDDVAGILPVETNLVGMTVGGGAIGRLTNRTNVRFEIRHVRNVGRQKEPPPGFGDTTRLSFWRATVGVSLLGSLF